MSWQPAQLADIDQMIQLSESNYQHEIDGFLTANPQELARNLAHAIIDRNFDLGTHLLQIYRTDNQIRAWTWLSRGSGTVYSRTATAEAHILHLDLTLSPRTRIQMIRSTLQLWTEWCEILEIPVLVSTTIRSDWSPFMRLHQQAGFQVRGSHAFKLINRKEE
jgi:hypothetical protein